MVLFGFGAFFDGLEAVQVGRVLDGAAAVGVQVSSFSLTDRLVLNPAWPRPSLFDHTVFISLLRFLNFLLFLALHDSSKMEV